MSDEGVTNHSGEPGPEGEPGKYTLAEFVALMDKDLQNEWTHLQFYLYHASAVTGLHAEEYKEFLTEAAKGELNHVQQFLDCLHGFNFVQPCAGGHPVETYARGEDILIAAQVLVQPCAGGHPFETYTRIEDILIAAHALERQVVTNYAKRLEQLKALDDKVAAAYLEVFYEDQLQDSFEDARHIQRILADVDLRQPRKLNNMDSRS